MAKRFVLTVEHLALLRAANVDWNGDEYGAASIDPKRPYGNGDVLGDIEKLLCPDGAIGALEISDDELEVRYERYEQLHRETKTALQIVLATGSFVAGDYVLEKDYTRDWRLAARRHDAPATSIDERLLRAIGCADEASTSMVPFGPMNGAWLAAFKSTLAAEGLGVVEVER